MTFEKNVKYSSIQIIHFVLQNAGTWSPSTPTVRPCHHWLYWHSAACNHCGPVRLKNNYWCKVLLNTAHTGFVISHTNLMVKIQQGGLIFFQIFQEIRGDVPDSQVISDHFKRHNKLRIKFSHCNRTCEGIWSTHLHSASTCCCSYFFSTSCTVKFGWSQWTSSDLTCLSRKP